MRPLRPFDSQLKSAPYISQNEVIVGLLTTSPSPCDRLMVKQPLEFLF